VFNASITLDVGKLDREDAVWLLKEVMAACPSFRSALAVSVEKERDSWVLSAHWVPGALDEDHLEKIVSAYGLEVVSSKGRTIFRSTKKLH
jgi:hypothetical protein